MSKLKISIDDIYINDPLYYSSDEYADIYFNRSQAVVSKDLKKRDTLVRYRVFFRKDGITCGFNKAIDYIYHILDAYANMKLWSLLDGEEFKADQTVMIYEGYADNILPLETTILGMISLSGPATGMKRVVDAAKGIPVIDMSPRHFLPEMVNGLAYAAYIGGAIGTSTQRGADYVDSRHFKVYGSIPHALNAIYEGSSIEAAKQYIKTFSDIPLTVLVDFEGRERDVIIEACKTFGDKLYAIRLDTHGGRIHQGGHTHKERTEDSYYYKKDSSISYELWNKYLIVDDADYVFGAGVTIEEVYNAREWLNENGCEHTKIVVSSGFNEEKVSAFVQSEAPMDMIGTGSWPDFTYQATADIYEVFENGQWIPRSKVGRPQVDEKEFDNLHLIEV